MDPDNEAAYVAYAGQAWTSLVRAAVFLGAQPSEADDLAQTTLVRCFTAWERVSAADNPDAYVFRMLLNNLRDSRRSAWSRNTRSVEVSDAMGTPSADHSDRVAIADAVHRAMEGLSRANREVVVLRYFVQLTEKQTAEVLGIAPGTVKSRLSRAIAHLAVNDHLLDLSGRGN